MENIEFNISDYNYRVIRDGEVSVKAIDKSKDQYDPIPCMVEHEGVMYSVTDMKWCFCDCSSLVKAPVIPDSVTNITSCFFQCSSLVEAPAIPDSVIDMQWCFSGCSSLVEAPVIPDCVTDMKWCFSDCSSLVHAPVIPDCVTDMSLCFAHCSSLVEAPVIPNSVTNMESCFCGCSSLVKAPAIPNGVTDMSYCFYGCSSLEVAPVIPGSVTDMSHCFSGCSSLVVAPVIPGSVPDMSHCFSGCSSLVQAPVIPDGVTNMSHCFSGCSSLVKAPVIPGSVTDMTYCFYDCALLKVTLTDILIEKAGVGSIIEFGSYPQGKQGKIAPIKWLMLAKEQGHILIISKYALDYKPYDTKFTSVTWENCSLRHWLNGEFMKRAFSPEERNRILESAVTADINPDYSTPPGNDTADKVFLLSILEAKKYFGSDGVRRCKGTEYCYAQGADEDLDNGNCKWWLRSPGILDFMASIVDEDGYVAKLGTLVGFMYAVRPALWISLES